MTELIIILLLLSDNKMVFIWLLSEAWHLDCFIT